MPYHVIVTPRKPEHRRAGEALALDKDAAWVEERVVQHWRQGNAIFIDGRTFAPDNIDKLLITETTQFSRQLMPEARKTPGVPLPPGLEIARGGQDVTDQFIIGPPGTSPRTDAAKAATFAANRKAVMVIYGHDVEANDALFGWLRAIGLQPREWSQLVASSGSASPYIGEVLVHAFQQAQAVVALFTPDERVRPRGHSGPWRLQARPNVLIEAGMALVTHPNRTVLVTLGPQELPSDLAGRHYIRLNYIPRRPAQRPGQPPGSRRLRHRQDWHRLARSCSIPQPRQRPALPSPTRDAVLGAIWTIDYGSQRNCSNPRA